MGNLMPLLKQSAPFPPVGFGLDQSRERRVRTVAGRRRKSAALLASAVGFLAFVPSWATAGTADSFFNGKNLVVATNYKSGNLPTNTTDVGLTVASGTLEVSSSSNAGSAVMESLSLSGTGSYTVADGFTANVTLTLGNYNAGSGFTNVWSGAANDLIYHDSSKLLAINGMTTGNGSLGLVMASSGNFDVAGGGSLTISSNISDGGSGYALTIDGTSSGDTQLSGTNTFSGGLVVTAGELDVASDLSCGGSGDNIAINGGNFSNISGDNVTITPAEPFCLAAAREPNSVHQDPLPR
jgi:autotransporter-associated beta strand protein